MKDMKVFVFLAGTWLSLPLQAASLAVQVWDGDHQPLPDAVAYLVSDQPFVVSAGNAYEVEQKDKTFSPFVTIMAAGSRASFPNRDGIGHHVYSFSPAKNFQLPLSDVEITDTITFDEPGIVTVGCNIHDWMVAYIYVVESAFFAKADADGRAVIENVPAGNYEIRVAHPGMRSAEPVSGQVTVGAEDSSSLEFTLEIKPRYFWQPAPRMHEEVY